MDSETVVCSNKPEVPFTAFLAGLTAWSVLKMVLEGVVQSINPEFSEDLKVDPRKRYDLYFGMWLGTLFKAISISACAMAIWTTSAEADIMGFTRPLNTAEQWCWGCRAVIYIQELPHINSIPELIIHHLLSLTSMIAILHFSIPRRQMYLFWVTLVSEFVSNTRLIMRFHGRLTARMSWWFSLAMAITILAFRVTGCIVAMAWVLESGTRGAPLLANVCGVSIYMFYMLMMTWRELDRAKIVVLEKTTQAAQLVIVERWRVSLFGVVIGLGFMCTELSALLIYEADSDRLSSRAELHDLAWAALQAVAAGLLGAYATSPVLRLAAKRSIQGRKRKGAPKLWLQGGFLSAAAALLFSPTIAGSIDKEAFLACMALSLPLLNAVRHLGYYYSGAGPSQIRHRTAFILPPSPPPSPPKEGSKEAAPLERAVSRPSSHSNQGMLTLSLIASLASGGLYCVLLAVHLTGLVDLYHAVCVGFTVQGAIHYEVEGRRQDKAKKEVVWTKVLLAVQIIAGVSYLEYVTAFTSTTYIYGPNILLVLAAVSVTLTMKGLSKPRQKRPPLAPHKEGSSSNGKSEERKGGTGGVKENAGKIAAVSITIVLILVLFLASYFDAMPSAVLSVEEAQRVVQKKGVGSRVWDAAWSWQFALSTLGVAVLPVVVLQAVN